MATNPRSTLRTTSQEKEATSADERIEILRSERQELADKLRSAAESQKRHYDKKHTPIKFKVKDEVMLAAKNIKQLRPNKKLSDKYLGPFKVLETVGPQAYRLQLPQGGVSTIYSTSLC